MIGSFQRMLIRQFRFNQDRYIGNERAKLKSATTSSLGYGDGSWKGLGHLCRWLLINRQIEANSDPWKRIKGPSRSSYFRMRKVGGDCTTLKLLVLFF